MNNTNLNHGQKETLQSAGFAVGGVVLPANNGPAYIIRTRIPSFSNGFPNILGCH